MKKYVWAMLLFGGVAMAQGYMALGPGLNIVSHEVRNFADSGTGTTTWRLDYDKGYALRMALGYELTPVRYEIEGRYVHNTIEDFRVGGVPPAGVAGHLNASIVSANVYYDIQDVEPNWVPYLGAGVGGANVRRQLNSVTYIDHIAGGGRVVVGQGLLGLRYVQTGWAIDLGYHYLTSTRANVDIKDSLGAKQRVRERLRDHTISASLNVYF